MTTLTRRRFLQGSALVATAVAVGWRPSLAPVPTPVVVETIAAGGDLAPVVVPRVMKMQSYIVVSRELLEDMSGAQGYVEEALRRALEPGAKVGSDELGFAHLVAPIDAGQIDRADPGYGWMTNETAFRLKQDWEAVPA